MEPREVRRRRARKMIVWGSGVVVALLLLLGIIDNLAVKWLNDNSGAVIALVTTVYVVFMILLWRATQRQAEITRLALQQQGKGEDQRRRAFAAMFLSELRLLEKALREAFPALGPGPKPIEFFQTPTYDNAGAHLLLFSPDTVQALIYCYQQLHGVRALWPSRCASKDLSAPVHYEFQRRVCREVAAAAADDWRDGPTAACRRSSAVL